MQFPDVPYLPLRLDEQERYFLDSLDGKMERILIGRREEETFSVLGYNKGRMNFLGYEPYLDEKDVKEYVTIEFDTKTGGREEQVFDAANYRTGTELILGLVTGMMYEGIRPFLPRQRVNERKQRVFYALALDYLHKNKEDLQKAIEDIPIYEGPIVDVERRLGKKLDFIDLGRIEQFLEAKDTFWLRVAAARVGADMVIQYTPGSAVGTPVRIVK